MADIILIFPRSGYGDFFIKDLPLSLLYASSKTIKDGFVVEIIDQRNCRNTWKEILQERLKADPLIVGISVMTGPSIHYAIEISKFVKTVLPKTSIVWGGHHPTILPEQTLNVPFIDFLIRGAGSIPLAGLARTLKNGSGAFSAIPGLSYKENGKLINNADIVSQEQISFEDIPYHLVDMLSYNRLGNENIFSIMTSFGCAYNCSFCYAPAIYRNRKWIAHSPEEVIAHIQMVINKFKVDCFSIIDDNFFFDMLRARQILEMIKKRRWNVSFQFRGVRVDELDRMPDEMLALMEKAGVRHIMVGAESGSNRILSLMSKGITVEQTIRVNLKLARHPKITPMYNLLTGIPGETLDDMKETVNLMKRLIEENKHCEISKLEHFMPLPGTRLFSLSREMGFKEPRALKAWSRFESETRADYSPWIDKRQRRYIRVMQVASLFIDNKVRREIRPRKFIFVMIIAGSYFYKFIARFRAKNHFSAFPIEYYVLKYGNRLLERKN